MNQLHKIEEIFANSSLIYYSKKKTGEYINVNQSYLSDHELTANEVIGKKDIDIWDGRAPILPINDRKIVLTNRTEIFIEDIEDPPTDPILNKKRFYISIKCPLILRSRKVAGIFGASFRINPKNPIEHTNVPENLIEALQFLQYGYLKNNNSFTHAKLTARQQECLRYLVRGMSVKQIAATIKLSPKTIENYLTIIKVKLNCVNRYQLIEKAFSLGLF